MTATGKKVTKLVHMTGLKWAYRGLAAKDLNGSACPVTTTAGIGNTFVVQASGAAVVSVTFKLSVSRNAFHKAATASKAVAVAVGGGSASCSRPVQTPTPPTPQPPPVSSTNIPDFSGYEVYPGAGASFSAMSASWTVPALSCASGVPLGSVSSTVAEWVGFQNGGGVLEQDGIDSYCTSTGPVYQAFSEIYPLDIVDDPLSIATYPVSAGDAFFASVTLSAATAEFTMADATQGWTDTINEPVGAASQNPTQAEWFVEDPSYGLDPLADFGSVTFSGMSATAGGQTGAPSAFSGVQEVQMLNGSPQSPGSEIIATAGPLDATGTSFTDSWVASG